MSTVPVESATALPQDVPYRQEANGTNFAEVRVAFMSLAMHLLLAATADAPCVFVGPHASAPRRVEVYFGGHVRHLTYCTGCADQVASALGRWGLLYRDGLAVYPGGAL